MQLFLAIDLPEEAKKEIRRQLEPFYQDYKVLTWVPPEQYHIMLHFVGPVADYKPIESRLKDLLWDIPAFRLTAFTGGIFIDDKLTFYIDFYRSQVLEDLAKRIKDDVQKEEDPKYKFIPHISIARHKIPSKQQYQLMKKKMERLKIDCEFDVTEVSLFESTQSSKGPTYKKLATIPLLQKEN